MKIIDVDDYKNIQVRDRLAFAKELILEAPNAFQVQRRFEISVQIAELIAELDRDLNARLSLDGSPLD